MDFLKAMPSHALGLDDPLAVAERSRRAAAGRQGILNVGMANRS